MRTRLLLRPAEAVGEPSRRQAVLSLGGQVPQLDLHQHRPEPAARRVRERARRHPRLLRHDSVDDGPVRQFPPRLAALRPAAAPEQRLPHRRPGDLLGAGLPDPRHRSRASCGWGHLRCELQPVVDPGHPVPPECGRPDPGLLDGRLRVGLSPAVAHRRGRVPHRRGARSRTVQGRRQRLPRRHRSHPDRHGPLHGHRLRRLGPNRPASWRRTRCAPRPPRRPARWS